MQPRNVGCLYASVHIRQRRFELGHQAGRSCPPCTLGVQERQPSPPRKWQLGRYVRSA